jgi:hypothetical protein
MQKNIIADVADRTPQPRWLDVSTLTDVDLTSEDPTHPVEHALLGDADGWHAGTPGAQTIRLRFHEALTLHRIRLIFEETSHARTQEFVLRWFPVRGDSGRDIVRQQFTFSPQGSTIEVEDYSVTLEGVGILELMIVPDISGGETLATVKEWRVA